jgi:hypothetical protein
MKKTFIFMFLLITANSLVADYEYQKIPTDLVSYWDPTKISRTKYDEMISRKTNKMVRKASKNYNFLSKNPEIWLRGNKYYFRPLISSFATHLFPIGSSEPPDELIEEFRIGLEEASMDWVEENYTFKNNHGDFVFDDFQFLLDVITRKIKPKTAKFFDFEHLPKFKLSKSKAQLDLCWFMLEKKRQPSLLFCKNYSCNPQTKAINFFSLAMSRLESLKSLELHALYDVSDEQLKIIGEGIAAATSLERVKITSALLYRLDQDRWQILKPFLQKSKSLKTLIFSGLKLEAKDWRPLI